MAESLPDGVIARIDVSVEGVAVNLREGMPAKDFAEMLRMIADAYEKNTTRRVEPGGTVPTMSDPVQTPVEAWIERSLAEAPAELDPATKARIARLLADPPAEGTENYIARLAQARADVEAFIEDGNSEHLIPTIPRPYTMQRLFLTSPEINALAVAVAKSIEPDCDARDAQEASAVIWMSNCAPVLKSMATLFAEATAND